ncbi:MAG: hypothetical protein ACK526_02135, partial [Planctomyces sp.]
MPKRLSARWILISVAVCGAFCCLAIRATSRAQNFVTSFDGKADVRKLSWLDEGLREGVHARTRELGLDTTFCGYYYPELQ